MELSFASAVVILLLVMDPVGNIPVFVALLRPVDPTRRTPVILRECGIAFAVLLFFVFFGDAILSLLGLSASALHIAGGLILFLIALRMIFPTEGGGVLGEPVEGEPFIVPLAIPLLAGPSALSALLLLSRSAPNRLGDWFLALTVAWAASAAILLSSGILVRLLRKRGLIAMERLMGMILVMLAVQLFLDGLSRYSGR